jgi:hypothetical protein
MAVDALPGVVPWTDLREVCADEEDVGSDEQVEHVFRVFAVKLTR